jgi:4-hydroxy-2-oxoheptanedioate aldolase
MVTMPQGISTTNAVPIGADYPQHANGTIVVFAVIEAAEALDNLDQILSVPRLDATYGGASGLSISLAVCRPSMTG